MNYNCCMHQLHHKFWDREHPNCNVFACEQCNEQMNSRKTSIIIIVLVELYSILFLWWINVFHLVCCSVAVMTKAYPNVERGDLILLEDIASYLLLACGLIYIISVSLQNFGCSFVFKYY